MTTRGATRRTRDAWRVEACNFAWSRWTAATLSHCSLPWGETFAALPLQDVTRAHGARDRLSIVSQFAAHQAFLSFAGLADGSFDPGEWIVVTSRGCDARLIRIGAAQADPAQAPPAVASVRALADLLGVSLEILGQPWARADLIFAEAFTKLSSDVAADLRWARRSAIGSIDSPGAELLSRIPETSESFRPADESCLRSFRRLCAMDDSIRLTLICGVSPLHRFSAFAFLQADDGTTEAMLAERVVGSAADGRQITFVTNADAIDAASWRVIEIASAAGHGAWISPRGATLLPRARWFVVAPSLAVRAAIENVVATKEDPAQWLDDLTADRDFATYLNTGSLPSTHIAAVDALTEPKRSFIGALALIGRSIPTDVARRFLEQFLFTGSPSELCVAGLLDVSDGHLVFMHEEARRQAALAIPAASRPAICRIAAAMTDGVTAALLWHEAGDAPRAAAILEQTEWPTSAAAAEAFGRLPPSLVTPTIAARFSSALIDCGRYREARHVAERAAADEREVIVARAERRTGDYASAIERLSRMKNRSFDAQLLYAELLRLTGRCEDAAVEITLARPFTDEERIRHGYELSVLALDCGFDADGAWMCDHHLAHRFATYRALSKGEYEEAAVHAERAFSSARTAWERIDTALDRLYAAFVSGDWDSARALGIEALREVEETQGDRAAGGILFTLAYLAADNGQWEYAENRIDVLRRYYAGMHDERREAELQLLAAHLEFSRGRFDRAVSAATEVYESRKTHDQIREAAALILDEIDWIEDRPAQHRTRGGAGNAELARRHERLQTLLSGRRVERNEPLRVCERLEAFREAIAAGDQALVASLASELGLAFDAVASPASTELDLLRTAATRQFPFAPRDFPQSWCFSKRNRLGQWSTFGSAEVEPSRLEAILAAGAPDWIRCGDHELVFIAGSGRWSRESRDAIGTLFHLRAENERLQRLLAEEDRIATGRTGVTPDGMVGESMAMRAVYELIARVSTRDIQVCVLGESGTGKELVARAIHRQSSRRHKPFVTLNCAALPENLIESELFGHVRGAFTGADRDRAGLIEAAEGGTLFLDEIGEMPLAAQAKLLRFLQDGEYRRVGDTAGRSADVRIVSATNRPLETAVEEGRFRDDLYYRIRGIDIHLPPLRDRGADVALLAAHFLRLEHERHRGGPARMSDDAEAAIGSYSWPGNVRELQNTIRAAHALAGDTRRIELQHLPDRLRAATVHSTPAGSYQDAVTRFRRELIEKSLAEAAGNQNRAATLLKMSRQALAYQIRELGILVGRTSRPL